MKLRYLKRLKLNESEINYLKKDLFEDYLLNPKEVEYLNFFSKLRYFSLKFYNPSENIKKQIKEYEGVHVYLDLSIDGIFNKKPILAWVSRSEELYKQNIGRTIIERLMTILQNKGFKKLYLNPLESALKFYESLNAKEIKNSENVYFIELKGR